jgi:hypothetical protein
LYINCIFISFESNIGFVSERGLVQKRYFKSTIGQLEMNILYSFSARYRAGEKGLIMGLEKDPF